MIEWIVKRERGAFPAAPWLSCLLLLVSSCQSYEARPLDEAAHRTAWHNRTLEDESLASFIERLAEDEQAEFEFDVTDGLSLGEAQLVAFVFNSELRAERMRAAAAGASAKYAGSWEDPQFSFDVLRVSENVPDRWVLNPVLTFELPLSGSQAAEQRVADASALAAEQRVALAQWRVHSQVRQAWLEWSAARMASEETARFVESMSDLVRMTSQLAEHGELLRTEASLFLVEQVQRENELGRMRGEVAALEQHLRAQLGLAPEAPARFLPVLTIAESSGQGLGTVSELAIRNPELAHLRLEYGVAEERLHHEIRKQYPDLTLGPQFESDQGQSRIGLQGGFPVPVWNVNRRAIEEARYARELARVAYETEYERLVGLHAAESARASALSAQQENAEAVLAPLVERQLADALALMRLGEGSSLVLLESLSRSHEVKLDLIEMRKDGALLQVKIERLVGPQLAAQTTTNTEESR